MCGAAPKGILCFGRSSSITFTSLREYAGVLFFGTFASWAHFSGYRLVADARSFAGGHRARISFDTEDQVIGNEFGGGHSCVSLHKKC